MEQQVESGGSGSWVILVVVGVVVVRSHLGSVIREFRAACRYSLSTPQARFRERHTVTQCASGVVGWSPFILRELLSMS